MLFAVIQLRQPSKQL